MFVADAPGSESGFQGGDGGPAEQVVTVPRPLTLPSPSGGEGTGQEEIDGFAMPSGRVELGTQVEEGVTIRLVHDHGGQNNRLHYFAKEPRVSHARRLTNGAYGGMLDGRIPDDCP